MSTQQTDVAIIGAGSTGLLLAQGLKHAGIAFEIFERHDKDYPSREWSMSLHWGAEFLTKALPPYLQAKLREIDTDPHHDTTKDPGFIQCNGETAETILMMKGMMPRRVSRTKLKALMSEGLEIQFDRKLQGIETADDSATAKFADGSSVRAKVIVGCDGSHSRVREIMVGDATLSDNLKTDFTLFNFPCSYSSEISEKVRDIHPVFKVAYHPKAPMMYLLAMADASPTDPAAWKHQNLISWAGPPYAADLTTQESRMKRLREIGGIWAHPWGTAAVNVPEDTIIYADAGTNWDPRPVFKSEGSKTSWNGHEWHGHVTLAGDAAHTMTPHRGQGLNNALQDASELLNAMKSVFQDRSKDLGTAIAAYEEEMVARGGLEVEVTSKQARAAHNWDMLMQSPMFKHGANKARDG